MATNLSGIQLGGVDQGNQWLLHTSGVALAGGIQVSLGNGDDTGLVIGTNWIGVAGSGGFEAQFTYAGGADSSLALPAGGGNLVSGTGVGVVKDDFNVQLGKTVLVTSATVTNATTSAVAVSDLNFTPAASGIYRFEIMLRVRSTATGTYCNIDLDGPAEVDAVVGHALRASNTGMSDSGAIGMGIKEVPTSIANVILTAADTDGHLFITGLLKMSASAPSGPMTIEVKASNTSGTVSVMEGSTAVFEKLN